MNYKSGLLLPLAVLLCAAAQASAGQIASQAQLSSLLGAGETLENFEGMNVPDNTYEQDLGPLNSTTTFAGRGPGLVKPGVTYSETGSMFWIGNGYFGVNTRALGDANGLGGRLLTLTYTQPVDAFGFDMQGYAGFPESGTVALYEGGGSLIDTFVVDGGFFGWYDPRGISRVTLQSPSGYILIDNHGFGLVPEPSSLILLGSGALSFILLSCRRRKLHGGRRSA